MHANVPVIFELPEKVNIKFLKTYKKHNVKYMYPRCNNKLTFYDTC